MSRKAVATCTTVDFATLIEWYVAQCDGRREHDYGVRLGTLDNPGWLLTVDLIHSDLQGQDMPELNEGCNPEGHPVSPRWLHASVRANVFRAACDPTQVARLFQIFDAFRRSIGSTGG